MKLRKNVVMIGLMVLSIGLMGCNIKSASENKDHDRTSEIPIETPTNANWFEGVGGKVIEIEKGKVHILMGDIVDVFTVSQASIDKVYLDEEVKIIKISDDEFEVLPFIIEAFTTRHTSMGLLIDSVSGLIKSISTNASGKVLTIDIDGNDVKSNFYGEMDLIEGNTYNFDIVRFKENEIMIVEIYDPLNVIEMTVEEIVRADDGSMTIVAVDSNGAKYIVSKGYAVVNFNLSALKKDDRIEVYVQVLMESYPMQVKTNKIVKK